MRYRRNSKGKVSELFYWQKQIIAITVIMIKLLLALNIIAAGSVLSSDVTQMQGPSWIFVGEPLKNGDLQSEKKMGDNIKMDL
jgi:hypothetical protein